MYNKYMSNVFEKFTKEINYKKTKSIESVNIIKAQLNEENQVFKIDFENTEIIPFSEMINFIKHINANFKYKVDFMFNIISPIFEEKNTFEYVDWIVGIYLKKINTAQLIKAAQKSVDLNGKLVIAVHKGASFQKVIAIKSDVERIMKKFGFAGFNIDLKESDEDINTLFEEDKKNNEEIAKQAFSRVKKENAPEKEIVKQSYGYADMAIEDIKGSNLQKVKTKGEIFKIDQRKTKTELQIFTFAITNGKDAIVIKQFASKPEKIKQISAFSEGEWIEVRGNYQIDAYTKEPVIISQGIKQGQNPFPKRIDDASQKRIELGARTRMSTMDGIATASALVKKAENWGHQAIAIVDSESVQSFPEFYLATKNSKIKPLYGITLNVLERNHEAIYNPIKEKKLLTDKYVVFDLETTGLSAHYDDIIEFGAVIIEEGRVIDKKQFFIKPTKSIPEKIQEITSITNEDVKNAKPESEAILDIRDYLGNHTLVAHNANFDISFVNSKLEKYGYEALNNPVVDTMIIARMTLPKAKRFNLQAVSKAYAVNYDSLIAHRADYDADVLAKVWVKMIYSLEEMGIKNQKELFDFKSEDVYLKAFNKEVTIMAKNQAGLKELFKLASKASTDHLYKGATIFLDEVKAAENVLLGSSGLKGNLVDKMIYSSRTKVIEEISHYDYIEVQPLQNFKHMYEDFSEEDIKDSIKFVIEEAKRQNKIVVATGDVRYIEPKEKIYHEVYINAKGLGGKPHYLKKYGVKDPIYPDQHMLTTKEMKEQFAFLDDINLIEEIVVKNTIKISEMIDDNIQIIKDKLFTPVLENADEKLTEIVYENAYAKYGNPLPEVIEKRIIKELNPIKKFGFAVIYWISHLLVDKSLQDGYLVGSRGSVGSSFVATMANITEVNPLEPHYICEECKHSEFFEDSELNSGFDLPPKDCPKCKKPMLADGQNIPFETFLGFNADKVPDIDLNFSGDYQPIIHNEVKNIFGENHSFRAGTISTVAEKTAFGYVRGWAESKNLDISRNFTEYLAKGVAGTKRTTGQHPGGIIVIPKNMDVEDFTPINFPANDKNSSWKTTHFDFHAIHDNVLKLDLLGHDDPTAIKYLEKLTGIDAKKDIPFQDENIIKLFSSTEPLKIKPADIDGEPTGAMGVPEFGTTFVRKMLKNAKVKSFGDLISVSGLSHGTDVWTGNAEKILKEKNLELSDLISCRDNIMVDLMNKKLDPLLSFQIMESVRKGKGLTSDWEEQLKKHNVEEWYIDSLKKIKYMFPKAHATAYVMMAWRIAWFKLYKPFAYYATYFTTRADVFDIETIVSGPKEIKTKLQDFKSRKNVRGEMALTNKDIALIPIYEIALEAYARNINIANIDVNKSEAKNWIIDYDKKELIPPLNAIDGLGDAVAESVVIARQASPFQSIEDIKKRSSINKTSIEKMKNLGILNKFSETNQLELDIFNI